MARGARDTKAAAGLLYGQRRVRKLSPPEKLPLYQARPETPPLLDMLDAKTCLELIKKYVPESPVEFPKKFLRHRLLWVDNMAPRIEYGWYQGQIDHWAIGVGRRRKRIPQSGKPPHCKYDDSLTLAAMRFRSEGSRIHQVYRRHSSKDDLVAAIDRAAREIFEAEHGYEPENYEVRPYRDTIGWSIARTLHIVQPSHDGWEKMEEFDGLEKWVNDPNGGPWRSSAARNGP